MSLGIAAVGGAPTAAFSQSDAARFSAFAPSVSKPAGGKKAAPAGGRSAWQEPMHEDSVDSWGADDDEDYGRKKRKASQETLPRSEGRRRSGPLPAGTSRELQLFCRGKGPGWRTKWNGARISREWTSLTSATAAGS